MGGGDRMYTVPMRPRGLPRKGGRGGVASAMGEKNKKDKTRQDKKKLVLLVRLSIARNYKYSCSAKTSFPALACPAGVLLSQRIRFTCTGHATQYL